MLVSWAHEIDEDECKTSDLESLGTENILSLLALYRTSLYC